MIIAYSIGKFLESFCDQIRFNTSIMKQIITHQTLLREILKASFCCLKILRIYRKDKNMKVAQVKFKNSKGEKIWLIIVK